MNKITDRMRYKRIAEDIPEYAEWALKKIKALDARKEKAKKSVKKPTKAQLEFREKIVPAVLCAITDELQSPKQIAEIVGCSTQRATAALIELKINGEVVRVKEKGSNFYKLPSN